MREKERERNPLSKPQLSVVVLQEKKIDTFHYPEPKYYSNQHRGYEIHFKKRTAARKGGGNRDNEM